MFRHYFIFAFRSLLRNKVFSFLNIVGLSIGLTCSFFITIHVVNELSYDKFYGNKERIFRVLTKSEDFSEFKQPKTSYCLGERFSTEFPEIENYAIHRNSYGNIKYQDNNFREEFAFATDELFNLLNIEIFKGDKIHPLKDRDDVYISSKLANKLFGTEEPIGKIIEFINWGNKHNVIVKGVYQDFPWNSTFTAELIANLDLFIDDYSKQFKYENVKNEWKYTAVSTFLLLKPNTDLIKLNNKIKDFSQKEFAESKEKYSFQLQNIQDIYLHSKDLANNPTPEGNLNDIYTFSAIAILILLIAGFNYIILATAKASSRNKEIGLRKVFGANRKTLIQQLLSESIVLVSLSLPLAYLLVEIYTPAVGNLFAQEIDFKGINTGLYILIFLCITITIGFFSGSYIAFYTSSFKPINVLKNTSLIGKGKLLSRKIMIVFQLIIFIALLIGSLTIYKQISFAQNTDLGFNKENVIKIQFSSFTFNSTQAYLNAIRNHPSVLSTSYASLGLPTESYGMFMIKHFEDEKKNIEVKTCALGPNYLETFEIELIKGRFLSEEFSTDFEKACLLNETAVRELGIKDPLNKEVAKRKIVGIVKDFNVHSIRNKIDPIFIRLNKKFTSEIIVKISSVNQAQTIEFLENKWNEIAPNQEFNHAYINEILYRMYGRERRFAKITIIFTIMAIFIACLGLFGLTLFIIEKRTKEIGIRKIHGASINNIMMMINKEFAYLVVIASLIAFPIAWYFIDDWLHSFAYSIDLPYELYIFSGFTALIIVLITVSIRSLKAALANPVDAIKYE